VQPVLIRRLTVEIARGLFARLSEKAPEWLRVCDFEVFEAFAIWATSEPVFFVDLDDGVVFITDWRPRLIARVHPVVWGNKAVAGLDGPSSTLSSIAKACTVGRVEALIPSKAPRGLARWCKRAGMQLEGTLRRSCLWCGNVVDGDLYALIMEV